MIGIIHLSDIHLNNKNDGVISKIKKVFDATKNQLIDTKEVIILISGDIANYGYKEQYEVAFEIILDLKYSLAEYLNKKVSLIMVPGNHDCDFSDEYKNEVRSILIKDIIKNRDVKESVIENCCNVQNNYYEFEDTFSEDNVCYKDKLISITNYNNENKNIYFVGINTSWISEKEESPNLFFPLGKYTDKLKELDGIVISILHHPSKWCHPIDSNEFDDGLNKYSNIVFQGHEHDSKAYNHEEKCTKDRKSVV